MAIRIPPCNRRYDPTKRSRWTTAHDWRPVAPGKVTVCRSCGRGGRWTGTRMEPADPPKSQLCTSSWGFVKCRRGRGHEGLCGTEGGVQWRRGRGMARKQIVADPHGTFPSSYGLGLVKDRR
jgi:hypothetical protein